ncbi:hypothetical protein CRYUN_Cryun11dG0053300 [Craigia yunnanensis]
MVKQVLNGSDADLVMKIPLSRNSMPDRLIWRESINGTITVKSAYFEARMQLDFVEVDRSSRRRMLKTVWMSKVAPKVKYFMWRLIQQCLPVKVNLREKGVQVQRTNIADHVKYWEEVLLVFEEERVLEKGLYTLWMIWNNRNDCVHNLKCRSPMNLGVLSTKLAEDFKGIASANTGDGQRILEDCQPSPRSYYKLNLDASYEYASGIASMGAVVRDAEAHVCLAALTRVEGVVSPFQAEIMTILFGLQVTNEQDFQELLVESDRLMAVKEIAQREESLCEWGSLIKDIQERSMDFNLCSFKHINRCANVLAHNLAKVDCEIGAQKMWRNSLPPSFCNPVLY